MSPVSPVTAASMSSRVSTSSSTARFRHSSRTSAAITPRTATRQWSTITMLRPSAPTMPSTTRTSTITWLRSSSDTAGASSPCTSETRCTTTRSTFSSTMPLPESKGSCRSSTAPTMKTLSLPFSQPVSPMVATASAKTSPARNLRSPKKTCLNTAPTAPTLSIHYTSAARNSRSTILSRSPCREYRNVLYCYCEHIAVCSLIDNCNVGIEAQCLTKFVDISMH